MHDLGHIMSSLLSECWPLGIGGFHGVTGVPFIALITRAILENNGRKAEFNLEITKTKTWNL